MGTFHITDLHNWTVLHGKSMLLLLQKKNRDSRSYIPTRAAVLMLWVWNPVLTVLLLAAGDDGSFVSSGRPEGRMSDKALLALLDDVRLGGTHPPCPCPRCHTRLTPESRLCILCNGNKCAEALHSVGGGGGGWQQVSPWGGGICLHAPKTDGYTPQFSLPSVHKFSPVSAASLVHDMARHQGDECTTEWKAVQVSRLDAEAQTVCQSAGGADRGG